MKALFNSSRFQKMRWSEKRLELCSCCKYAKIGSSTREYIYSRWHVDRIDHAVEVHYNFFNVFNTLLPSVVASTGEALTYYKKHLTPTEF